LNIWCTRNSRSPSPWREESRSRSRSKSRSRSRSLERPRRTSPSRGRGRVEAVNPGNTLYVTGLSTRVTERELEDHFSKEGKVASCFLVVEPRTRISRGFAFVTMDNVDDANRCVKYLNQSILEGRYITVEKVFRLYSEQFCVSYVGSNQFIHVNLVKQHDQ
ncbi:Serine/arginine-rich splicing factor SR45a, partial [Linum perenne]